MRLHVKGGFDPVFLELAAIVILMALLGGVIYYYGHLYNMRAEVSRVMRYPNTF
jgi:hypothetical protein